MSIPRLAIIQAATGLSIPPESDQHLSADNSGNIRRFDRKVLVRPFGLDLEGLYPFSLNQLFHILHGFLADGVQIALRLYRRADGSYSEHPGNLPDELFFFELLVRSDIDQSLVSLNFGSFEFAEIFSYPFCQHAFKIRFVHPLQSHLSASDNKNILFVHFFTIPHSIIEMSPVF